jgi:hypothetical protein
MSEVWIQVIAGASGLITTLAVRYLEHLLKRRPDAADPAPAPSTAKHLATEKHLTTEEQ